MEVAVTVVGPDRPGIVADVASRLALLRANLTDSTMTRLRGHFAMTLICSTPTDVATVEQAMSTLRGGLLVSVREVGPDSALSGADGGYLVTVHGADRLGIVAVVTRAIAEAGGNITDLSTRLAGDLYLLVAEVDMSIRAAESLSSGLDALAAELGVEISLRPTDVDLL